MAAPDPDTQLQIERLLYRYALGADQRDGALLAGCFAPGCRIVGPGYELTGDLGAIIVAELTRRFAWTQHNVFNPLYELGGGHGGNEATGTVNCIASHVELQPDGNALKHDWYIRYHDRLLRDGGEWRFAERRMDVRYIASGPVTPLG
jgi:hypothetical protein